MKYRVFQYRLPADGGLEDLNSFLASHRITSVSQYVVPSGQCSLLVFVVEYLAAETSSPAKMKSKIDYREELNECEFASYNRLRDERKKIAEEEGVPVYALFSNAQLAEMVQNHVRSESELAKISGIGKSRVQKYSARILPILMDFDAQQKDSDNRP